MTLMRKLVNPHRKPTASPQAIVPSRIEFRAGHQNVRMPFIEGLETPDDGWQMILHYTMAGYRADRVGNSIVITGHPVGFGGGRA